MTIRENLLSRKGWWNCTFFFYKILCFLRKFEETKSLIKNIWNKSKRNHSNLKTKIRTNLLTLSKIFYRLAGDQGMKKNYKLEKVLYYPSAWLLELKDLI